METSKSLLGAQHPDMLDSMASLAFTWKDQGLHEGALALMKDCVEARQQISGPYHSAILSSLSTARN